MNNSAIRKAAAFLQSGELVAFPTETVYGLGANALSDNAVAAIYAAKGRPSFNPLIVHVRSLEEAQTYAELNDTALGLAHRFWPGPLTLVLPRRADCTLSLLVSAGMDTVAIRVPAHPLAQALLAEAQLPIAAPSANRSGKISPTEAAHVEEELGGRIAMILDGGPCEVGIESTVIDATTSSGNSSSRLDHTHRSWDCRYNWNPSSAILAPGMLASHYAPSKPVRLDAKDAQPDEALLAFGIPLPGHSVMENLSPTGNLQEAAANLFRMLRRLDASAGLRIAVMPIPDEGLGIAINDRLRRAAAPNTGE